MIQLNQVNAEYITTHTVPYILHVPQRVHGMICRKNSAHACTFTNVHVHVHVCTFQVSASCEYTQRLRTFSTKIFVVSKAVNGC